MRLLGTSAPAGRVAIGVVAIGWYLAGQNRVKRSLVPPILACTALGAKILGLVLELSDSKDAGDDIGAGQFLLLFVIVATVAYLRTRPTVESSTGERTGRARAR